MANSLPPPVCRAFLVCQQVVDDQKLGETVLVGLPRFHRHHRYPTARMFGFFARLAEARGTYEVEVQLRNEDGDIVWRDGPPTPWKLDDPLTLYDLKLNMNVVFPETGEYEFVLALNGEEIARQAFKALPAPQPTQA
jgi:hypothetical protein